MKRSVRYLVIGLVLLVLGGLVAWFLASFHRVEREFQLPPRGEARYNPLYALRMTLQGYGVEAVSRKDLNFDAMALAPQDMLLLDIDVRTLTAAQVETLMSWVEGGGRLLFRLPAGDEGRSGELLDTLSLRVKSHFSCHEWSEAAAATAGAGAQKASSAPKPADGETSARADAQDLARTLEQLRRLFGASFGNDKAGSGRFCSEFRFTTDSEYEADFDWLWGNSDDGFIFGRHPWGEGSVLVAADFDALHNSALDSPGYQALAWQLIGPSLGKGRAFLVYAADVLPWYVLLMRYGWPVIVPLLLALLAWLWARSQRLGPLLQLAPPHRRALLAHVQAAGEFAFARGRGAALHAAVLRAFQQRLRRRDPVTAALGGEALLQTLAERHQIPLARVRQALQPQDLSRPEQFLVSIRTLMQLRALT